ncbi:FAD-dependent oxidoreductase [Amycolatopsis sp. K13G38]|uniref:FAD-dependent oxidoreductase n=1 Tax=Amycolatopsis acididurans TaxID=2724524 RepID=A0ABX1JK78_9PSEU|nr:FAD-dependent oxidoreductase [Amycolatopsis acididurans]NKQ58657.1 FAD-dependent oxidoreductase [Amycolatopsis acididurans]
MRQAVVLGASIAGLLSARVLSEAYDRVLIVERDEIAGVAPRRGVPQARHLHGLMERGRQIIEELYPGLTADLAGQGAPTTEVLQESRWYLSGLRVRPTSTGLTTLLAGRPLLESAIRERTLASPGVELRTRRAAAGLIGGERITGVRLSDGTELGAELVVDATGRGSRAPEWLAGLGHARPQEERIDVDLGYSSRTYRRKPEHLDGDLAVVVSTTPGFRGGGAITLEGDRWHVTLAGMLGDHPPSDPAAFEAFAATLPVPDVYDIVREAEPLDDPVPHRFRGSLRRRYDKISRPPRGFLVIGDAVSSFNPLYAQGMTVAAQQALALRECLPHPDPVRFYRATAAVIDVAWQMSTGSDLRYPGVAGPRTPRSRIVGAYAARARVAAHRDPVVARTLMRTTNLTIPPASLLTPDIVWRVLARGGQ